jgi:hypothetical protein
MKSTLFACLVLGFTLAARAADAGAPVANVYIKDLLVDFLAHNSDPARHEKFWADDLVYTSSRAVVSNKTEIMKEVRLAADAKQSAAQTPAGQQAGTVLPVYSAEDIQIQPYAGFATLAFRLVVRKPDGTVDYYRNSGTLVFRDGRWQAILWQATKVPPAEKK